MYSYWLSEDDVAADGVVGQSGVLVDVADGLDVDGGTDVLDGVCDHSQAHGPRQLLTRRQ